ncbi:MAG: RsmG family class I SAM-dependent methyltransferase, partial [Elusimicrobiota bacterium]
KKCLFLDYIKSELELKGVEVVCERAEALAKNPAYQNNFDLVFNRALSQRQKTFEICRDLVKPGGCIFFWQTEKEGDNFLEYTLPGAKKARYIVVK